MRRPQDVDLLNKVLNEWPDRETTAILARCTEAGRPWRRARGRRRGRRRPPGLTIEMVLLGGTTDPLARYRRRCATVGLDMTAAGPGRSGRFVVECPSQSEA
jgi:hypothetical protein